MTTTTETKYRCDICQKVTHNNNGWMKMVHPPITLYEITTQTIEDVCEDCWGHILKAIIPLKLRKR